VDFKRLEAPYLRPKNRVTWVMAQVLIALVPATVAYVWYFGPGILFNIVIASVFCIVGESLMLALRGRRPEDTLIDLTAIVAGVLIAYALPPLTPWWVTATAGLFAMIVAKHLYGGLGFNIFNPAMAGYVVVLLTFPHHLNLWLAPAIGDVDYQTLSVLDTLKTIATGSLPDEYTFDAISRATPLDALQAGLNQSRTVGEILAMPLMGDFGGRGWEWIANFIALGGFWLLYRGVIRWHIPAGVLAGLLVPTTLFYFIDSGANAGPGFHLFSGATLLCAFFIATDPVSAAASPRGRLIFGAGIGLLIFAIRKWGAYADGVAFAVLLMNLAVPLIDQLTRTRVVGEERV